MSKWFVIPLTRCMYSLGRREDQSPINLLSTSLPTTVSGSQPQNSKPGCVKDQKIKMATPLKIFKTDRFVCTLETLTPVVKTYFPWFSLRIEMFFFTADSKFFGPGQARGRTANTWVEGRVQGGKQQVSDENALKKKQDVKTTRMSIKGEVKCKVAIRCQFSERALSEASFMVSLPNRLCLD